MEEIRSIVNAITKGCATGGIDVPDVLAAFVARTVVENDATSFSLDRKMTVEKIDEVILRSIEKLLERDSPSLETIKMQVDYDTAYLKDENASQKTIRLRNKMIAAHKIGIVEIEMEDHNDFETLTSLYRKIFRYLLEFAPNSKQGDRLVEREVAAALESVFPRTGLKTFAALGHEEKSTQLIELAMIVLGIRLFNRDQGRGGAGLDKMEVDGLQLVNVMVEDVDREVEFFADACNKYQIAINRARLKKKRVELIKKIEEDEAQAKANYNKADQDAGIVIQKAEIKVLPHEVDDLPFVHDFLVERWCQELTNRRQYLSFLRILQDELHSLQEKISHICELIRAELANLKGLVSSKSSVPKEIVYPRFETVGTNWINLYEELMVLTGRSNTFRTLCKYRLSFQPTLSEEYYLNLKLKELSIEVKSEAKEHKEDISATDAAAEAKIDIAEEKQEDKPQSTFDTGVTILNSYDTPDYMLLPLELQGFCIWTLVEAYGLVVSGKPALGVARYDNMYFVFDHQGGMSEFIKKPDYYLNKLKERALKQPEYIHLLRLQRWFPSASIARLLEQQDVDQRTMGGKPMTRDASTGTPTHFIETYIDLNYHWNEWELRRRALKVVSLKNCGTKGSQTDNSHFRRDTESQVYEPRQKGTQTKRDKGVNPPIVTTYIAGLRGKKPADAKAVSKYEKDGEVDDEKDDKNFVANDKVRLVKLTLDL